jgi:hypothetical protein
MAFLIDTNILFRSVQPHHPQSGVVERALALLRTRHEVLHIATQNLIEFWAVATRPEAENGLGMSVEMAADFSALFVPFRRVHRATCHERGFPVP